MQSRINIITANCLACEKAAEVTLCDHLLSLLGVHPEPIVIIDQDLHILWSNQSMQIHTSENPPFDLRSLFIRRIETLRDLYVESQTPHELIRDYGSLGGVRVAKIISLSSTPLFGKAHILALAIEGADNGQAAAKSDVRCPYNIKQKNNSTTKMNACVPINEPIQPQGEKNNV